MRLFGWIAVALTFAAVSCRPADQIETYTVPKEAARRLASAESPTTSPSSESADRMLAAILPDGGKAWFLKVVGPVATVDKHEQQINQFFASVRSAADKAHPDWKLPEGWEERAGSGMRAATVVIPSEDQPLEISVTSLPWSGAPEEILSNVNRWRGQMQLAPVESQGLANCTSQLSAGDVKLTVVDLRGHMKSGGMSPPFAGGATPEANRAPGSATRDSGTNAALPAGHPPIAGSSPDLPAGHPTIEVPVPRHESPLSFKAPDGWREKPASGMRKASFSITDGTKAAEVSVIDFPAAAGPMMADPLANVNRWRGEVGLEAVTEADLAHATESIEIDGQKALLVDAVPDAAKPEQSQADRGTLAAMLKSGETIWFVKMTGDRDVVAGQRDQFKAFLKSIRFNGSGGVHDGN
jgi:hypothetical protein